MRRNSSRGPRMFTISTEAGTVTRRSSSRPPSSALEPDAFLNEFGTDDSRGRALGASGALAVNSELLSWFLADDGECQHLILGQGRATPPTLTCCEHCASRAALVRRSKWTRSSVRERRQTGRLQAGNAASGAI